MSARRKSTVNVKMTSRVENQKLKSSAAELERLEQETTLVLQEIDHNLSKANAIIDDKMFPILKKYATATGKVWESVGFWKSFMEEAADIEIKAQSEKLPPKPPIAQDPQPLHSPVAYYENEADPYRDNTLDSGCGEPDTSTPNKTVSHSHQSALSANTNGGHLRLSVSPRKHTPVRPQRVSLLGNVVDSSPPLPQRPILLSDAGRQATHSSSFLGRATTAEEESDGGDNSQLGRLSPITISNIATTPRSVPLKQAVDQDWELAKELTPPVLLSVQRTYKRRSSNDPTSALKSRRYSDQHRDIVTQINNSRSQFSLEPPIMTSDMQSGSVNTSLRRNAELSRQQSLSMNDKTSRQLDTTGITGSPRRRNLPMQHIDNDTNLFTVNEKVTATIIGERASAFQSAEELGNSQLAQSNTRVRSRSFSQLIEDVLDHNGESSASPSI